MLARDAALSAGREKYPVPGEKACLSDGFCGSRWSARTAATNAKSAITEGQIAEKNRRDLEDSAQEERG
jgi:hypothetical protein